MDGLSCVISGFMRLDYAESPHTILDVSGKRVNPVLVDVESAKNTCPVSRLTRSQRGSGQFASSPTWSTFVCEILSRMSAKFPELISETSMP
jgi:hypothetical protein